MKIDASFVTSAAGPDAFPRDGRAIVAFVGRSNVGKSSLINALVGRRLARTSATPGKTRLANIYAVARGGREPCYLVDLPGYGFATGGPEGALAFARVARACFGQGGQNVAGLLLVDARHPGLEKDLEAWRWLQSVVESAGIAATKIDKLPRGQRIRARRELESVFDAPVAPCSAATGEGLDDLWKLMDRLANSRNPSRPSSSRPRAMARPHPKG